MDAPIRIIVLMGPAGAGKTTVGLALAAWGAFLRAAQTIQKDGSFNLLAQNAASAELNERFRGKS